MLAETYNGVNGLSLHPPLLEVEVAAGVAGPVNSEPQLLEFVTFVDQLKKSAEIWDDSDPIPDSQRRDSSIPEKNESGVGKMLDT